MPYRLTLQPVSYTHLDVYKRQVLLIIVTNPYLVMFERPPPREIISLMNLPPRERELSMKSSLLPLTK